MSFETMEGIVKLIQKGNPKLSVAKDVDCSQPAVSEIWCKCKKNEVVKKKENIQVDHKRYQSVGTENSMSKLSVSPSGERTFTFRVLYSIIMAATVSLGRPLTRSIYSVFPLCME